MGLFSLEKLFGMTIRESANDGSDFTNPDADYRRLFLGEDGQLHVKDSAGAVTDIGGVVTEITDLPTADTTTTNVLAPDGAGGVEWRAEAGGGIDSGTSFPGSPSAGDLFWRTDLGLLAYYDGTRWLTTTKYMLPLANIAGAQPWSAATDGLYGACPTLGGAYDVWLESFEAAAKVQTTNNGSNYWTLTLRKTHANTFTTIVAPTTAALTAGDFTLISTAIGALLGTTEFAFTVYCTKTNAPGNLYILANVVYRLVLT